MADPEFENSSSTQQAGPFPYAKIGLLLLLLALFGGFLAAYGDSLSIESLARREAELRAFQSEHPYLVVGIALGIYALATGFSVPGAAALTLVYGWYFNVGPGVLIVSFASTAGATIAFLLSRYFLGGWVQKKFGDRLEAFNQRLSEEGAFYLFSLRLIPAVPFFVINLVMGLTRLPVSTYWWVSQLGMLPATFVFVYAGSRVPNLNVLAEKGASAVFSPPQLFQLTLAFGLLGVFPLIVKKLMQRFTLGQAQGA